MIETVMRLMASALCLAAASAGAYLLDKKTPVARLPYWARQALFGVIFGGLSVCGTEFGVDIGGATANIRDAAALTAGLLFGAPAGIIAGVIGGVERWFAALWGAGMYTRLACSLATMLSGVFAGALRKHMFDDRKPSWSAALFLGFVMEVLHMLLIFVTNMADVHTAFTTVERCALPMILANGVATALSVLAVSVISGERNHRVFGRRDIAHRFQSLLLACVVIAFMITCAFSFLLQTRLSRTDNDTLLRLNIADVTAQVQEASDRNMLTLTKRVAADVRAAGQAADSAYLTFLADKYGVPEIDRIGTNGVIEASTNPTFVGFDMASGEQSAAFLPLLNNTAPIVQSYQPISFNALIYRKYAGVSIPEGGFVQVGYDAERFQQDIASQIAGATHNRHIGESGSIIVCDRSWKIVSSLLGDEGKHLSSVGLTINEAATPCGERFIADVYGKESVCMYDVSEGYRIIGVLPMSEAELSRDLSVYMMAFMEVVLFAAVFIQIYLLIKRVIVDNIHRINSSLSRITDGDLNVQVDVRSSTEFASLSDDINATVQTLKRYIAEAEARIDRELAFAREIQHSALPSLFPPFPEHDEFDIYALMTAAKEVGGDFYDFYFVGENQLAFLVADVSGKGIPAALFMMRARTLIKSFAETGMPLSDVFTRANDRLCRNNDAGMFVTAWLGVLNIKTGHVEFVNAGHNPPLVCHGSDGYTYLSMRAGFVLAGMEGVRYRSGELQLAPGERLYLYTDGVTEATDALNVLYGEARLETALNANAGLPQEALLHAVHEDVNRFVGSAPQFDDITMLGLTYLGAKRPLDEWSGTPEPSVAPEVAAFVENTLVAGGCPDKTLRRMNIAVDELFSNIIRYSGATLARVACGVENGTAVLVLSDNGTPYDPTAQPEPDITLSAEDRPIGGLGVFMVKRSVDSVDYAYRDGWNELTVRRKWAETEKRAAT